MPMLVLPRLEILNLSHNNNLSSLSSDLFGSIPSLSTLDLAYTSISDLPASLGCCVSLSTLIIHHTSIQLIPKFLFVSFKNLNKIFHDFEFISNYQKNQNNGEAEKNWNLAILDTVRILNFFEENRNKFFITFKEYCMISHRDLKWETCLEIAVEQECSGFVKDYFENYERYTRIEPTSIIEIFKLAIQNRRLLIIETILEFIKRNKMDRVFNGDSALIYVYKLSHSDPLIINKMIELGYPINSQDSNGNTLIHIIYQNFNDASTSVSRVLEILLNVG